MLINHYVDIQNLSIFSKEVPEEIFVDVGKTPHEYLFVLVSTSILWSLICCLGIAWLGINLSAINCMWSSREDCVYTLCIIKCDKTKST